MSTGFIIGVDIGTQGTKAALFDAEGNCLAEAMQPSNLIKPAPGVVEEDPEEQVAAVCTAVKACVEKAGVDPAGAAGIGIDGQMAGIIGIGEDGKNVTPYDSWLDTRCAPWITVMKREAEDEIVEKTGGPPSFNHGPKILWWMHEQPEVFKKIRSFIQPGGYAVMRLCGMKAEDAFIDVSYLHFSGFADNRNAVWDDGLCSHFKLDRGKLPRIVSPHEIAGKLTAEMSERCGLKAGTPVVAGCGDTAASFLSCGATEEGICVDVAGTASVFATTTGEMLVDYSKVLGCGQSAVPGLWHPYAYINGGGMNLEWFRNEIANQGGQGREMSFDELTALAGKIEPAETDPVFIPHLGGRVSPSQPHLRGAWLGMTWDHSIGHMYRAVYEGVALEYGIYMNTLKKTAGTFEPVEIRITGGGGKSALWNKIKADALGIPVIQLTRNEGAPLGSALLAGYGTGMFSDLKQTAEQWIRKGAAVEPDAAMTAFYGKRIEKYADFIKAVNNIHEKDYQEG